MPFLVKREAERTDMRCSVISHWFSTGLLRALITMHHDHPSTHTRGTACSVWFWPWNAFLTFWLIGLQGTCSKMFEKPSFWPPWPRLHIPGPFCLQGSQGEAGVAHFIGKENKGQGIALPVALGTFWAKWSQRAASAVASWGALALSLLEIAVFVTAGRDGTGLPVEGHLNASESAQGDILRNVSKDS